MMYAVYNPDGSIYQANKVYDQPDYGKLLSDHSMPYAAINSPDLVNNNLFFVHTASEEITRRPTMRIELSKKVIKAGSKDYALFTKIPKEAKWRILGSGVQLFPRPGIDPEVLGETELQISIPVPCIYQVQFDLWPYQTYSVNIEAV